MVDQGKNVGGIGGSPNEQRYFAYGASEVDYLAKRDPVLANAMQAIGHIQRPVQVELFPALINSIVSQQISTAAGKTIFGRINARCSPLTPASILAATDDELQATGLTWTKVGYIKGIAAGVAAGDVDLDALWQKEDEQVIAELTRFKGIGRWTAEMLLIFALERPNVLAFDDLAIQRGMRMLYRHRVITRKLFEKYRRRYSPHASVASLYLWAIAGGALPNLQDPAAKKRAGHTII
jgi:DNA-3-methyladenine glycosylase II